MNGEIFFEFDFAPTTEAIFYISKMPLQSWGTMSMYAPGQCNQHMLFREFLFTVQWWDTEKDHGDGGKDFVMRRSGVGKFIRVSKEHHNLTTKAATTTTIAYSKNPLYICGCHYLSHELKEISEGRYVVLDGISANEPSDFFVDPGTYEHNIAFINRI